MNNTLKNISIATSQKKNNRVDCIYKYKRITDNRSVQETDIVVTDKAFNFVGKDNTNVGITILLPMLCDDNNEWKSVITGIIVCNV